MKRIHQRTLRMKIECLKMIFYRCRATMNRPRIFLLKIPSTDKKKSGKKFSKHASLTPKDDKLSSNSSFTCSIWVKFLMISNANRMIMNNFVFVSHHIVEWLFHFYKRLYLSFWLGLGDFVSLFVFFQLLALVQVLLVHLILVSQHVVEFLLYLQKLLDLLFRFGFQNFIFLLMIFELAILNVIFLFHFLFIGNHIIELLFDF